ncbi:hypothetical protein [Massilia aerilata]|uniref:Holin n=1 Tax=Massilia aerilata TaxID=453817 RepID=A0ABW0S6N4_9BURK
MSEPISGAAAAGAAVGWKALGGLAGAAGIGAGFASYIVMTMTKPKDDKEFRVSMASTIAGSLLGGAAAIKYFGIEHWSKDIIGLMGQGGVMLTCGLPAWLIIRALFRYIEKRKDAGIDELVADGAKAVKAIKDAV